LFIFVLQFFFSVDTLHAYRPVIVLMPNW